LGNNGAKNIIDELDFILTPIKGEGFLKPLGLTLHISKSGLLTVKAKNPPRIGSTAFLRGIGPIGTVIDVFGPVASPYVSVKLRRPLVNSQVVNAEVSWEEREFRRGRDRGRRFYAKRSY
jgi:rRNA processing protein Gar1